MRALAGAGPLLVAVDDAQWVDAPSATALAFSLRRLRDEPVGFLVTRRMEESGAPVLGLDRLPLEVRLERLGLGPLSVAALQRLLRTRLDLTPTRPLLRRIHDTCRGNPLFALELGRALRERRERWVAGEPLPVPDELRVLVRERLDALPPETREALLAAACVSHASIEMVEAVTRRDAGDGLRPAVEAHVVVVAAGEVRFSHPLFASCVIETADAERRRAVHRLLADLAGGGEQRSRHLALAATGPDVSVAAELEGAARAAAERGAPESAAELAEQARRLTPVDRRDDACRRTIDAGWYHFVAGDSARAEALLTEAAASPPSAPARVRALTRLARLNMHAGDRRAALELYRAALRDGGENPAQAAEVHEGLAWCLFLMRDDVALAARHARTAVGLAERLGDRVLLADALAVQAQSELFLGGGLPSAPMERALALGSQHGELRVLRAPAQHWAVMLLCADQLDAARAELLRVRGLALAHGDESALPWVLMRLSHAELLAGNWGLAARHAADAHEIAVQNGQRPLQAELRCTQALIDAHLGAVDSTRIAAEQGAALATKLGAGIGARLAPWALGLLELSLGNPGATVRQLEPLRRASEAAGIAEPGENRYLADLVEALVLVGRLDDAGTVVGDLERRGSGLGRPSVLAAAGRGRGLIAAARGDLEGAIAFFEGALAEHERAGIPFERARTLLWLGATRRRARAKRAAREALDEALAGFERLGASLWAQRARAELARISGRLPSSGGLTATEQQVAALVAEGRTNREVAAELYVSDRTVEYHLSNIYAKLGVRSRAELARRFHA